MIWILPLFATLDWLTQTLNKRLSTTPIRLITGSLFGIWLGIVVHALLLFDLQLLLILGIQSAIYITLVTGVLLSNRGCIDKYLKTYEEFIMEYQRQNTFK